MPVDWDVVVIGAGAAGLTAFRELHAAGLKVLCVEARGRIGGRIATIHDPLAPVPIELGAEFVHGRSPEIWSIVRAAALTAYSCEGRAVHIEDGKPRAAHDAWQLIDRVMKDMEKAASKRGDQTFADFIGRSSHDQEAKRLAVSYVEGFNAAHKEVVGIASLAEDARASHAIGGGGSFRIMNGYDALPLHLLRGIDSTRSKLALNSVVERIDWKPGEAVLHISGRLIASAPSGAMERVSAHQVVITVPLGALQAEPGAPGSIRFYPEPDAVLEAARRLRFGHVIRLVVCFREPFWEKIAGLEDAGFLLSSEPSFPTWWTTLPVRAPVLTGWSAGPHADALLEQPRSAIIARALADLARITGVTAGKLNRLAETAHLHEWHADPFALGAYSYVPAGALAARKVLAKPLADTLYFAGEATELNGHSATVHGAIATGKRTARQILARRAS